MAVTLALTLVATPSARAAGEVLASVLGASGEAVVIRPASVATPLRAGMMLGAGDRLVTRADGRVTLRLDDGTLLALHPNTEFPLDARRLEAEAPRGLLVLMRAALRTVSGALGRRVPGEARPPPTAGATIGRRAVPVAPTGPDPAAAGAVCPTPGCTPLAVRLAAGPARDDASPR